MRHVLLAVPLFLVAPAAAQMAMPDTPHPACPSSPAAPDGGVARWAAKTTVKAATNTQELALATLQLGEGTGTTLAPAMSVSFARQPEHRPAPGTFGGEFGFAVTNAGSYRVSLSGGVWIDVVKDGQALRSTAHGHGPDCSGVRKYVDFALEPGRYVLQVSGSTDASLTLMVGNLP